jgi:hypothetical protein
MQPVGECPFLGTELPIRSPLCPYADVPFSTGSTSERAHEKDLATVGSMRSSPHRRIADARGNDATEVPDRPSSWVPTQQTTLDEENLLRKGGGGSYELIALLASIIPA